MSATPAGKEPTDPLLTIDEAANYLTIPKATLYTWRTRRAGFGPRAIKMGGCLRFRRSDLDDWILDQHRARKGHLPQADPEVRRERPDRRPS